MASSSRASKALAAEFADDAVDIDQKVFNPARISKVYGTVSRKGDDTPDRPHRLSRMLSAPAALRPVPLELLMKLAATAPVAEEPEAQSHHRYNGHEFDLGDWIREHHVPVGQAEAWKGSGRRWIFNECPWNSSHKKSAFIVQWPGGMIGGGCHHNSCSSRNWHSIRDAYEPGWQDRRQQHQHQHHDNGQTRQTAKPKPEPVEEAARAAVQPLLTCLADVEARDVAWFWRYRIPMGRITFIVGRPGEGKSFFTIDMTARVTTGTPWPDGAECPLGSVIIISAEDDPHDTIRPHSTRIMPTVGGCISCRWCAGLGRTANRMTSCSPSPTFRRWSSSYPESPGLQVSHHRPHRELPGRPHQCRIATTRSGRCCRL